MNDVNVMPLRLFNIQLSFQWLVHRKTNENQQQQQHSNENLNRQKLQLAQALV